MRRPHILCCKCKKPIGLGPYHEYKDACTLVTQYWHDKPDGEFNCWGTTFAGIVQEFWKTIWKAKRKEVIQLPRNPR